MESANETFLDFQQKMMEHITGGLSFYGPVHLMGTLMRGWAGAAVSTAHGMVCPLPIPLSGSTESIHYAMLPVHDGTESRLAVRLLKWVDGTPLVSTRREHARWLRRMVIDSV